MSSKHQDFKKNHCRVCSNSMGRSKYNCLKYSELLGHFGVDPAHDNSLVQPEFFCNVCYMTAKRISQSSFHRTSRVLFQWVPHNDTCCYICDIQCKGGRPKKKTSGGRPSLLQQHIMSVSSTVPQFELSQVVDETRKIDVMCCSCNLAANRAIEIIPCKSLICCSCCMTLVSEASFRCPGCHDEHDSSPSSFTKPSPLVEKMLNEMLVICKRCVRKIKLEVIDKECMHHEREFNLTLQDITNHSFEVEPTQMETRAAAQIISRALQHTDNSMVRVSTGGRVR